jgi:hypothetical protein
MEIPHGFVSAFEMAAKPRHIEQGIARPVSAQLGADGGQPFG